MEAVRVAAERHRRREASPLESCEGGCVKMLLRSQPRQSRLRRGTVFFRILLMKAEELGPAVASRFCLGAVREALTERNTEAKYIYIYIHDYVYGLTFKST